MVERTHKFQTRRWPVQILCWLWASPTTGLGLIAGGMGMLTGGRGKRIGPTLEFWDGAVTKLLQSRFIRARGMTLGHVILGVSESTLETIRSHEWVHVQQYERWGLLFLPAYLFSSAVLWLSGRDPYWENPFEVEAYAEDRRRVSGRSDGEQP
jgi:hypothetical protein